MARFVLEFRLDKVGGPVVNGYLSRGHLFTLKAASRVVFLIHGYNVNRPRGQDKLDALSALLPGAEADCALVSVLWPGDSKAGTLSYPFEGRDADDTALQLARFITETWPQGAELNFVSHSLGARVVLETIRRLRPGRFDIKQVCLLAAAVDDTCLATDVRYFDTAAAERVAVLASREDRVLKRAYPVGDLFAAFIYKDERSARAMGLEGAKGGRSNPLPANVKNFQIPDARRAGHDDYLPEVPPNNEQISCALFCNEVLTGVSTPVYP